MHKDSARVSWHAPRNLIRSVVMAATAIVLGGSMVAGQSASPGGGERELVPGEPLSPGVYRSAALGDVTFEVADDGWVTTVDAPGGGFGFVRAELPGSLDVARFEGEVFGETCDTQAIDATAEAFMGFVADAGGVASATEPAPVSVGGLDGLAVDITTREHPVCPGPALAWVVPTLGRFLVGPGSVTHIVALDAGDHVITIVVDAPAEGAEAVRAAAQGIIDSLSFQGVLIDRSPVPSVAAPAP
jgi:hypothetical protein